MCATTVSRLHCNATPIDSAPLSARVTPKMRAHDSLSGDAAPGSAILSRTNADPCAFERLLSRLVALEQRHQQQVRSLIQHAVDHSSAAHRTRAAHAAARPADFAIASKSIRSFATHPPPTCTIRAFGYQMQLPRTNPAASSMRTSK